MAVAHLVLVRRMPAARSFAFLIAAGLLASCNTYRVAGAMTYGRIHDLSAAEIEVALAAYRRSKPEASPVGQIQVVNSTEIRVYWGDSSCCFSTVRRERDAWKFAGDQVLWTQ